MSPLRLRRAVCQVRPEVAGGHRRRPRSRAAGAGQADDDRGPRPRRRQDHSVGHEEQGGDSFGKIDHYIKLSFQKGHEGI